jgi:hypothetical protein
MQPTQLEEIQKTTSIFLKMEDHLKFVSNGKQLQFFGKWRTTLIFYHIPFPLKGRGQHAVIKLVGWGWGCLKI